MNDAVTVGLVVEVMDLLARAGGGCTESEAADAIRDVLAGSPDQPRVPAGGPGGGQFGSGGGGGGAAKAPAGKTPKAAPAPKKAGDAAVKKALDKVAKAKAAVVKAKDGLIKAQKELKDLKSKAKAESPRAKAAAAKAKDAKPVDVAAHVAATKELADKAVAGKEAKSGEQYGGLSWKFTMPAAAYESAVAGHLAALGKLNKEQVLAVARGFDLTAPKTKADAIDRIRVKINNLRGTQARAYA